MSENKSRVYDSSSMRNEMSPTMAAQKVKQSYLNFINESSALLSKVDQSLLLDIVYYETKYKDWEGSALLRVVYPAGIDIEQKKEKIYQKYQHMSSIEEGKTLRFKAVRVSLEAIGKLLEEDPEIEYITGSASLSPGGSYTA